jgi:hypothetical protein
MNAFGQLPSFGPSNALQSLYFNTPVPQQGYMRAPPPPTLGDRLANVVSSGLQHVGVNKRTAGMFAGRLSDAAAALTPFGAATEGQQAARSLQGGNYGAAALHGLGAALSAMPDGGAAVMHSIIAPLYHGSPFLFDKFALEKIGTGEGAQAYGHGLYFAENPEVARAYRDTLSSPVRRQFSHDDNNPQEIAAMLWRTLGGRGGEQGKRTAASQALKLADSYPEQRDAYLKAADIIQNGDPYAGFSPGHLYEVKLDANPEDFLNWDAPLATQPDILGRLPMAPGVENKTGGDYVQYGLGNGHNSYLMDRGIPGIRYLDQGSRTAGQGTHNYVVFDPSIIDILNRQ